MSTKSPIARHRSQTKKLARSLKQRDIYEWLMRFGYFPENYVLPPCFSVETMPARPKPYFVVTKAGKYHVTRSECVSVHFPKSELTDRTFGIINPQIYSDLCLTIARNWKKLVDAMIPADSQVASYSFPIPLDAGSPGRLGFLRSGRMIYEFIAMTDDDLCSVAYRYTHLVRADIKSYYPSVYTHSIAWALHGKSFIRKPANLHDYTRLGNRLDKLMQSANDGCTNGIPVGPVGSDVIAEVIAAGVDRQFTSAAIAAGVICEAVRFKDDYRILVRSEADGRKVIKCLQAALRSFNLELSDEKTRLLTLPDGLFREWASRYHAVYPRKLKSFTWKQFRELYLAVIQIDRACPSTGVIDRFLADIVTRTGRLKVVVADFNLEKVISMLLMLGALRLKAFPKVMAIMEVVIESPFGIGHREQVVEYLEGYLKKLAVEEERNKYLIAWISYFLVSNDLIHFLTFKPKLKDPITRSIFNNRAVVFKECKDFKLFVGCRKMKKRVSMIGHLEVFNPPQRG